MELNNQYDRFAVAGSSVVHGKIGQTTVGHLPREISRYIWYTLQNGAVITGNVTDTTSRVSPLVQRGLEIKIDVLVTWDDTRRMNILKEKLDTVDFNSYCDERKEILHEIGIDNDMDEDEE